MDRAGASHGHVSALRPLARRVSADRRAARKSRSFRAMTNGAILDTVRDRMDVPYYVASAPPALKNERTRHVFRLAATCTLASRASGREHPSVTSR